MKIVGKLHDYYDGAMAYGQDDTLFFNRASVVCNINEHKDIFSEIQGLLDIEVFRRGWYQQYTKLPHFSRRDAAGINYSFDPVIIGFCGKMYFGFNVKEEYTSTKIEQLSFYIYSVDDAKKLDAKYKFSQRKNHYQDDDKLSIDQIFSKYADAVSQIDVTEVCIKHKIPYFIINTIRGSVYETILVPELKKYDFQKVKDPFTAFQEISMYLGGVIPRQVPELAVVTDEDRIKQYGFNDLSFKHPFKFKREKK